MDSPIKKIVPPFNVFPFILYFLVFYNSCDIHVMAKFGSRRNLETGGNFIRGVQWGLKSLGEKTKIEFFLAFLWSPFGVTARFQSKFCLDICMGPGNGNGCNGDGIITT